MQPLVINSFSPKATITVYTKQGEVFSQEVVNDAISLNIVRGVDASAGQAVLTLTANQDKKGRSWQDRIHPMDYIEIRAGNKYLSNGKLPIRFRGFLDSVTETLGMPVMGGPTRRINVVARDYVKLFLIENIQYLWTNMLGVDVGGYPGLNRSYGIAASSNVKASVGEILRLIVTNIFNGSYDSTYPFLPAFRKETGFSWLPSIYLHNTIPTRFMSEDLTIQPYTGPVWSLINYLCSPPVGESFIYDGPDFPTLVCRPVPFRDFNGNFVSPGGEPELPTIKVDPSVVSGYTLGKTDAQVKNFFFVYSDALSNNGSTAPLYISKSISTSELANGGSGFNPYSGNSRSTNPYWNGKSATIYGLNPLNVSTPWVELPSKDGTLTTNAEELSTFLGKVYDHNENLIGGQLICHGDESFIHGRYVQFSDAEFYLEQFEDNFSFIGDNNPNWTTVLSVTRGQSK